MSWTCPYPRLVRVADRQPGRLDHHRARLRVRLGSLAFWTPRASEEINSDTWRLLTQLAPFPLDGLTGLTLGMLLSGVPIGLVAWFPPRALLGMAPASWAAEAFLLGAALVFAVLATWIFTRGLRRYGRIGSSCYLDYGHRR